jgi:positive regulator of sigma E activity
MLKKTQVIKVSDNSITVRFGNSVACQGCNCLFKGYGDLDFEADNSHNNIAIGDVAVIEIPERNITIAPLVVFGLPLVALGLGLGIGSIWGLMIQGILMISLLCISLVILYFWDKYIKSKIKYSMSLKDVISSVDQPLDTCGTSILDPI